VKNGLENVFINRVSFTDSRYNKEHSGSAFLIRYNEKVYGVTAKHILQFTKTDTMKSVHFGDNLESWEFYIPNKPQFTIKVGNLINSNPNELLEDPIFGDWLIFEIKDSIPKEVNVFELSRKSLFNGDELTVWGFPYNSNPSDKPFHCSGEFDRYNHENHSFYMNVPKHDYLGCSGGPIVDTIGNIVGLVSKGYFDESLQKMIFQPSSISYFKEVLDRSNSFTGGT
jgi:hypothetical protein